MCRARDLKPFYIKPLNIFLQNNLKNRGSSEFTTFDEERKGHITCAWRPTTADHTHLQSDLGRHWTYRNLVNKPSHSGACHDRSSQAEHLKLERFKAFWFLSKL